MYEIEDIKKAIMLVAERVQEISEELTEIDSKLGDGDMGISMTKGAVSIAEASRNFSGNSVKDLFAQCAFALNKAAPSTMGTLLAGALLAVAKTFSTKEAFNEEEVVQIAKVMSDSISSRGRSKVGDKTILDAMVPYAETMLSVWNTEKDLRKAHDAACQAARDGLESTKGMKAKTGRASWLGERNREFPDAGAFMFCRVMEVF